MDIRIPRPFAGGAAVALLAAAIVAAPATSRADTSNCTVIAAVPYTISTAGHYCLASNVAFSGTGAHAIRINASNVALDCHHFVVQDNAATTASGISFTGRSSVVVRNCTVRGFYRGIYVVGGAARSSAVEITGNTIQGARYAGIQAELRSSAIEGNRVVDTTGATGINVTSDAGGIVAVNGNSIHGITGSGQVNGILVAGSGRVLVNDNVLSTLGTPSTSAAAAIRINSVAALKPVSAEVSGNQLFDPVAIRNIPVTRLATTAKALCTDNFVTNGAIAWETGNGCL